jgi:hypothetical protein
MKDVANLRFEDQDGNVVLYSDYGRTSTLEFTSDQVYAYNKSTKSVRFDNNREGTMTFETELFDLSLLALLFGTSLKEGEQDIAKREKFTVSKGVTTLDALEAAPADGTLSVFEVDPKAMASHVRQLTLAASETPAAGEYYINKDNQIIVNADDFADGGAVAAYYLTSTNVKYFTVDAESFPEGYVIYGDTKIRGVDQKDEYIQFKLYNAKPQSNVTFGMDSDNVASLSISVDILSDGSGNMMTYSQIA